MVYLYFKQMMKFGPDVFNMIHKERFRAAMFAKQIEHETLRQHEKMRQIEIMKKTNSKNNVVFMNKSKTFIFYF
jgi:hypothetical protein